MMRGMRQRQRRFAGYLLAIVVSLLVPRPSRAAATARLAYVKGDGAERCPGEQAVRASVSARLGYDPFLETASDTLTVEIQRREGAFRTRVALLDSQRTERGAREIAVAGDNCSDAVELMGLTISLIIDPSVLLGGGPPAAPAPAPSPLTTVPAPEPLPLAEPVTITAPPAHRLSFYGGLRAIGSVRSAPTPAFGGALFVGAAWRMLSLDVEGRADYPASGASDASPTEVRSRLATVGLAPCLHIAVAFGCPIVAAGMIEASARNVAMSRTEHGPWSAVGGRLGIEGVIAPRFGLRFRAHAELLAVLTRDTFLVDGMRVYGASPWTAALAVDALWLFR
jgi:hypothetical protein